MQSKKQTIHVGVACVLFALLASATSAVAASVEKLLYEFCSVSGCGDGSLPYGVIFDAAGNVYGTTVSGGANNRGTVFQLTPNGDGTWTENVIYRFGGNDGEAPWAGVILDPVGNLYGTTGAGGRWGEGTVFELNPNGDGTWTERILHSFYHNKTDGRAPMAGLVMDATGNLYGTTPFGGHTNHACPGPGRVCGTVFELSPGADGSWKEKILYSFCSKRSTCADGIAPVGGVILGSTGELYGTTSIGGNSPNCRPHGCGLVFQLSPGSTGRWKERVLHTFTGGKDSQDPESSLTPDAAGNLYGTTRLTVFELLRNSGWKEKVLHSFKPGSVGVDHPLTSVVFDGSGNLYGATKNGGDHLLCHEGCGTVFRLVPQGKGKWSLETIYRFNSAGSDGTQPNSSVTFDPAGNLYGTTMSGGIGPCVFGLPGCGTVFEITP